MDFKGCVEQYRKLVEEGITRWVPSSRTRPRILHEAMNYSLKAGGKRLRPVLLLAGNSLFPSRADPIPAAVAIECLHTYSLIHDDLPSMDNSDLRRGVPTCHVQFDEATAILAGDALLTHAFALLADAYRAQTDLALSLISDMGKAADSQRLIGGQMEDILGEKRDITEDQLEYIHSNKTAAMISSALTMGVRLTEADEQNIRLAADLGRNLGLAYQIVDDILDATGDTETLGKRAGADANNSKNTYIKILGLEDSREKARELTTAAVEVCGNIDAETEFLVSLIQWMEHRIN